MALLYQNRFFIGVTVEGKDLDFAPSAYSFVIKDSIHNLYPTASITFRDLSGQFNEFMTFVDGVKVAITYGLQDKNITCPFIITRNSMPEQISRTSAGGLLEIPLIHEYYFNQSKQSLAFNDEISNIIRKKAEKFNFKSINIDTTINKGIWYQPYLSDADFMVKNLLPFAYSSDSQSSPFYLYIDLNNNFYFKSYKKLYMDEKAIYKLKLAPNVTVESMTADVLYSFNPTQVSILDIKEELHRLLFNFDSSGVYDDVQDTISDYPSSGTNKFIPITWDLNNLTNTVELLSEDIQMENTRNNNIGLQNNSMKKAYNIDRVIMMCNLNTDLTSGKKIELNIPIGSDQDKIESSQRYTGNYLIETAYHKWTGALGKTILVCSRQDVNLPSNYTRNSILVSR